MNSTQCMAILVLLCCVCLMGTAAAEDLPEAVTALCAGKYPGYAVAATAGGGSDAQGQFALVLIKDGHNVLCIAEKGPEDAAYAFTVETDTAVRQGDDIPELFIDTGGDALFYTYRDGDYAYRYHAMKTQTGWGDVDVTVMYTVSREYSTNTELSYHETAVFMDGSDLMVTNFIFDENENMLSCSTLAPLHAPWLEGAFRLDTFDINVWSTQDENVLYTRSALAALPEGYTVAEAKLTSAALLAEAADAQGVRSLIIIEIAQDGTLTITQSSPMSEGVRPDLFHAGNSVGIRVYPDFNIKENYAIYSFSRRADGRWTLSGVMSQSDIFGYLTFGLRCDTSTWLIGDYPVIDLAGVNWTALPTTLTQAIDTLDQSGWARVTSDDPGSRLHLRAAPDRSAQSLGKYYQGTPVRVLSSKGDWTEVDVFGVRGYMMTKWLAFDADMNGVENAFPSQLGMTYRYSALEAGIGIYASPSDRVPIATLKADNWHPDPVILGVVGDEWYHIIYPETGLSGYIRQDTLWPGNG